MSTKSNKIINSKYIFVIICFLGTILMSLVIIGYKSYVTRKEKNVVYKELNRKFNYDLNIRLELINGYEKLLQDKNCFSYNQLSVIYGNLAVLYVLQDNYEKAVDCSVYATKNSELSGDLYMKAWCLNNVANIFIEMDVYDIAEDMFKEALNTPISNPIEAILIKEYTKVNLADIYSRQGRNEEAEKIINEKGEWQKLEDYNVKMIDMIRNTIDARINLNRGNYRETSKIIDTIEYDEKTSDEVLVRNIVMPKLQIETQLYFATDKYDTAKNLAKKYIEICDKNNYHLEKIKYLHNFYKLSKQYNTSFPTEYSDFLMREYPVVLRKRNMASSEFIMYTHKRTELYLEEINKNMEYNIILVILFLVSIVLIYLLVKRLLKANKRGKIDALTQLNNRRNFDVVYKKHLSSHAAFGIIFIDIDHFKTVNDVYGHEFGDMVLKKVGENLAKNMRKNDKGFRYGGEEFCVICKTECKGDVINLAERLRSSVESISWDNGIHVTISVGVSHSRDKGDLIFIADKNMYQSKINGRNKVTS